MTPSTKSPGAIPRPVVVGLLAVVAIGIVLQMRDSQPVGDAPESPVIQGTTEIASMTIVTAVSGTGLPTLTRGDLVLGADGSLWTAWLEFDGTIGHLKVAQSADAGQTFGPSETLTVPGGPAHFGVPIRLAAEADGDVVLGAMNHRPIAAPARYEPLVTVFRHAHGATEWMVLPEAESLVGVSGSLRLRSLAAYRDGALVAIERQEVTDASVVRDLQPGVRTPLALPTTLSGEIAEMALWATADGATLFCRLKNGDVLYQSRLEPSSNSFGPAAVLHQAEAGHQLRFESLLPAPDGSAMLHVSEDWSLIPRPDFYTGLEQVAYDKLPQDARQRRDRLLWIGNKSGELSGPIRGKVREIDDVVRGLDALPMGDGWLMIGQQYKLGNFRDPNDRDRIRLVSIGVDAQGKESPLSMLWEDHDLAISGTRLSNPVLFPNGSWAIVVSNRDQKKLPRREDLTLFRFAPSTSPTE